MTDQLGEAVAAFAATQPFALDEFQLDACRSLVEGAGVLVAAPTGAGKTIVGEFAVHLALSSGGKCFYTTPIKALSNQKYADLVARHGQDQVGLLTGDTTRNGEAPVVVMTTEVLRNMLYAGSPTLRGLKFVVMDEVHYLADPFRGAAWEEVIIHLPESVTVVSLSATVSNAEEFGEWLATVRGRTDVVVSEHRPVPLWQHVLVGDSLADLFVDHGDARAQGDPRVNPDLLRLRSGHPRGREDQRRRGRGGSRPRTRDRRPFTPSRPEVLIRLDREGLLPAITFIFSRAGCQGAVEQCLRAGLRLTSAAEADRIRETIDRACVDIPDGDRAVLGFGVWRDGLERGIAAHHAGMLPAFREVVEDLFVRGLVKAVFATETLALGINMPARSVVLEKLVKWNGETHAPITPGEYTQLTGRAGRRGIDVEGHAIVVWQPTLDASAVGGLASTRTYPLRSSFRPSYNMAVNLVAQLGRERARALLETSFAQFQADRSVVSLAGQVRQQEDALDGYAEAMACEHGDFAEYDGLRAALRERERGLSRQRVHDRRAEAASSLQRLRRGDVIVVPKGRNAGTAVVVDPGLGGDEPRPAVVTVDRRYRRLSLVDFPAPVQALDRLRIPKSFNPRSPQSRRELADRLAGTGVAAGRPRRDRAVAADDPEIARLRAALRAHPCHGCPQREDHARWAERRRRLSADTDKLRRRVAGRTATVARTFDRVCAVLAELDYLDGDWVGADGRRLARLYSEADLLAAECLRLGLWAGLRPAELAACVAALTFESRNPEDAAPPRVPEGPVREALAEMTRLWATLEAVERRHRLSFIREPDLGFVWAAYRWAGGKPLEVVLREADLPAGDFVRWTKQLIDLLGQIAQAADGELAETAEVAVDRLRRGVVAYSSIA